MAFTPKVAASRNAFLRLSWGQLNATPFSIGVWALLEPAGQQNHAPQLCWLSKDQLACVWMAGGQEGAAGMAIYGSVLNKQKSAWEKPRLIGQHPGMSEQNPLLVIDDTHQIHLIHTAQTARDPADLSWQLSGSAFSMQWTARLYRQSTSGWRHTWSESTILDEAPAFCRNPPVKTKSGEWMLPIYRSLETQGAFGFDYSEVALFDSDFSKINKIIEIPNSRGRVHGSIVPSADGKSFIQFFRSRLADRIYRSVGSSDGESWSEPFAIDLPNNNSSIQALRLSSRRLAVVFNRFSIDHSLDDPRPWGEARWPTTRWPLSIALSEDDGLSWPWIRDLDAGDGFAGVANYSLNSQFAYPCIVEGIPGELHIAYSWGSRLAIRYLVIRESDILG